MAIADPRGSISFSVTAANPTLPDTAQAGLLLGCCAANPNTPRSYGSGAAVRAAFLECPVTEIAETHFASDRARHPILVCGMEVTTAGVLHLDTSELTGGATATPDGSTKPLGDWPNVYVEFITGGVAGTTGIEVYLSLDGGITKKRKALGASAIVEFVGYGIKFTLSGTFSAGWVITGWTSPPRWDSDDLATAKAQILLSAHKFGLICIAEPIVPADLSALSSLLDDLEAGIPARPATLIASARRQYKPVTSTITATFANANPDTLARDSGSFVTDGFKAGMSVTITDSLTNNGTFAKIATVATSLLTFTSNVSFTGEIATANVVVEGFESDANYADNLFAEWTGYEDERVIIMNVPIRASRPFDGWAPDENLAGHLFSRYVSEPIEVEAAQHQVNAKGGGTVAPKLGGRITENNELVLLDAATLATLVTPGSFNALERAADGTGPYFTQIRTMKPSSQIDRGVHARIVVEAKYTIIAVGSALQFSAFDADPADPSKLSTGATAFIENALRVALQTKLGSAINNAFQEDPGGALASISDETDLTTGIVIVDTFFRSKFYLRGLSVRMTIKVPGA